MTIRERLCFFWREERYRTDLKQFVEFGLGYGVVLVLGYFLLRKINLTLSVEQMGLFSYVSSWVTILAPVLCLAAPQAYLRFHDNHSVSLSLRRFLFPFFCLSSALLAAFVFWKTHSWFAILYALNPFFLERTYLLRSQMQIRALNFLRTCELLVPLLGLYLLMPYIYLDAAWVLGLYGLGYTVAWLFRARQSTADEGFDKATVIRFLWPLVFTTLIVSFLNNVAVILAKHFLGYEAAGQMGVAVRALLFSRSLTAIFLMFYPMIYFREAKKGNFVIINVYRMSMLAMVFIALTCFAIFAPFLYGILGAARYFSTITVFRILLAVEFVNFVFDVFCSYFAYEVKTWKGAILKSVSLLVIGCGVPLLCRAGISLENIAALILGSGTVNAVVGVLWALKLERRCVRKVLGSGTGREELK